MFERGGALIILFVGALKLSAPSRVHDAGSAKKKERMLMNLILSSDIVAIQGSHGNKVSVNKLIKVHDKTHDAGFSLHYNPMAGGNFSWVF